MKLSKLNKYFYIVTLLLGVISIAFPFIHDYWYFGQSNLGIIDSLYILNGFIYIFMGFFIYLGQKYLLQRPFKYQVVTILSLYFISIIGIFIYSNILSSKVNNWNIATYEINKNDTKKFFDHAKSKSMLSASDVTDADAEFIADPIILKDSDSIYCFFEVGLKTKKGVIGLASSKDGVYWKYNKIVLREPFHLSFPLVLKENNTFYMIPESSHDSTIRLYVSTNFPYNWKLDTIILKDNSFMDNVIFKYHKQWWLFTSTSNDNLLLYYSTTLKGPWKAHPSNPIKSNYPDGSRMAGKIFVKNDSLFRLAQDDYPNYGNNLRTFYISKIDSISYEEKEVVILPDFRALNSFSANGVHSCNLIETDSSYIVVIDEY